MMVQAESGGATAIRRQSATSVALVISLPILSMQVQEALGRQPDIEVRLTAHTVAELAAFAGRDWLEVVICQSADAKEIGGLLHPGQELVTLGPGGGGSKSHNDTHADLARSTWPTLLTACSQTPPAHGPTVQERRTKAPEVGRRNLVAWLLQQHGHEVEFANSAGDYPATSAGEWILSSIPHLGKETAVVFLGAHRIPEIRRDPANLLTRLRSAVRAEDAVLRIDDSTLAVLMSVPTPPSIPSLLIRLSWRLWPADPGLVAASHAVWQFGQDIEAVIVAGRLALVAALGTPQRSDTVTARRASGRTAGGPTKAADQLLPAWGAPHPDLRRRGLEIEPWCADLPGFAGENALQLAVEAQEEEEFGHVGHGLGVARVAEGLASALGLRADVIAQLRTAALLHDGGKLALDRALWGGRSIIMPWQRKLMESHASFGSELADQAGVSDEAVLAILHHHERWDGAGYPANLHGDLIPLPARILFVAEVVDSMLRPSYRRQPLTPAQVVQVLEAGAGRIWDPDVARHAVRMVRGSS